MSDPKRRFLERMRQSIPTSLASGSPSATVIGKDTVVDGGLRGNGPYVVFGEVRGNGELSGPLHLAASAHWHGDIRAAQVVIAGRLTGNLDVDDTLEIGHTAVIHGRVRARSIAIATGAVIEGEVQITSTSSILHFVEKRGG